MGNCSMCWVENRPLGFPGLCPFRARGAYEPVRRSSTEDLHCGSILNGKYVVGPSRDTHFAHSYRGFNKKIGDKVIIWEFFPFHHARRLVGFPQVAYHKCAHLPDDCPETYAEYWLEKFYSFENLTMSLRVEPEKNCFPMWYESFQENNTAYFVTELVEGESLETYLMRMGGTVPWYEALRLLTPTAEALAAIHRRDAVHGGLTPERIILTPARKADPDPYDTFTNEFLRGMPETQLMDTGLQTIWNDYIFQSVDDAWPDHWQPYRYSSVRTYQSPVTDIYSLAACFYRAVYGMPPESPSSMEGRTSLPVPEGKENIGLPARAEQALLEALQFMPERFSTVRDFWSIIQSSAKIC